MKKVNGIGGVFFKSADPNGSKSWYQKHLGIKSRPYGGTFEWRKADSPDSKGFTAWSVFDENSDYYEPSKKDFMINYRVHDLVALIEELKSDGVEVIGKIESFEYGKFAWIMDPDGLKIELWEPVDDVYESMGSDDEVNKMG